MVTASKQLRDLEIEGSTRRVLETEIQLIDRLPDLARRFRAITRIGDMRAKSWQASSRWSRFVEPLPETASPPTLKFTIAVFPARMLRSSSTLCRPSPPGVNAVAA